MEPRYPLPPFTAETAAQKVQMAENAWNTKDPVKVSLAYTPDTEWRNRAEFLSGRDAVVDFLTRKWAKELDYRLKKELWAFTDNQIGVRFEYEWGAGAMARWSRAMVPLLRQRNVGVRRKRLYETTLRQYQRRADQRSRPTPVSVNCPMIQ